MKDLFNWLKNEESGQGMVEYGLIIAVVAIVAIGVLALMGGKIKSTFTKANTELDKAVATTP